MEKRGMLSLDPAEKIITKLYIANPRRSLSGTLKYLKEQKRFSVFGDYPIISFVLQTLYTLRVEISSYKIEYAVRTSSDFNSLPPEDKKAIRQQLFRNLYVQKNDTESSHK